MEIWKDVKDYEGLYQVSNLGNVRTFDRLVEQKSGYPRPLRGRIMKLTLDGNGYPRVDLCKDKQRTIKSVHR